MEGASGASAGSWALGGLERWTGKTWRGDPNELVLDEAVMTKPQALPQTPSLHLCPRQAQSRPEVRSSVYTLAPSHSLLPLDHGASYFLTCLLLCHWPILTFLCPFSWDISLSYSGTTYPAVLGLVPVSVVKDAGLGFQWGGQGLIEASGDLLDEARCSGQGQGTNF